MHARQRAWLGFAGRIATLTMVALWTVPAHAQKPPDPTAQEVLIKTTLLTFNDANVTQNYTVLHAKLSKQFRDQFSPDRLKEVFKPFVQQKIDIDVIASRAPIPTKEATVDDRGILSLNGRFDTTPSNVIYDLGYVMSDGEWKPIKINVDVRPPDK